MQQKLDHLWWALRIGLGVGPFLAGLDKFFYLLTDWTQYLSPVVTNLVPVSAVTFMQVVGLVEMAAGILVLTRFTREAAYVVCAWLVVIAGNLLLTGRFFDVAVRDLEIALAAFVLAQLTELRHTLQVAERPRISTQVAPAAFQQ